MEVLTPAQMRAADAQACAIRGEAALMRTAGERIAALARLYARSGRIVGFAGPGKNGGDVFAALAQLPEFERTIYAQARAHESGVQLRPLPDSPDAIRESLHECGLAVVGLFGTGARLPLPPIYAPLIAALNACDAPVLAIDVTPGVDAARGTIVEPALHADATITLGALKLGLLLAPARENVGDLWLGEIGMPPESIAAQSSTIAALNDREFLDLLPRRADSTEKRAAGAPFILAGSEQFPGAAVLCAMGAARAGAGYVTLATPHAAASAMRLHLIEQVVVTYDPAAPAEAVVADLLDITKRCSSAAIGPGLGLDDRTGAIVREFARACELPMVIDASALFHFAKHLDILRGKAALLTPHAGEFARLSGKGSLREEERIERLREFVHRNGVTTLLKGETTLIDGGTMLHVNTTGTSALATAGTGDVLTGIIATLLSQGLSPVDAARAGAYWHGLAGKHAQRRRPRGVIARDIYESLAAAIPRPLPSTDLLRIF